MTSLRSAQFLLECLRGPQPEVGAQLDQLGKKHWQELAQLAAAQGLGPLLYERLTTAPEPPKVPEDILQGLRESFLMNGLRNRLLYQDLAQVLRALQEDGIPVIVLKGAHLAALVYPQIALRVMGDIDLLVKKADLKAAAAKLQQIGYSFETMVDLDTWLNRASHRSHLPSLFKPPRPRIEIHWRIESAQPVQSVPDLWSRAQPANLGGVDTLVLAPEDLLLHLCLHGSNHHLFDFGLRMVCDLRAALERYGETIHWNRLLAVAREWRVEKCVHLSLELAHELLGAPTPAPVLAELKPADFQAHWQAVAAERITGITEGSDPKAALALHTLGTIADVFAPSSGAAKRRGFLTTVFPSRHYMAHHMANQYSLPLTPMRRWTCYFTRVVHWLGKSVHLGWYALAHAQEAVRYIRNHFRDQHHRILLREWLHND